MESQSEETGSRFDGVLLIVAVLALFGGMGAFYALDPQWAKLPRLGLLLGGIVVAVLATWRTAVGGATWEYLIGARAEMRKIVWPTRQESVQTTLVIAVFVLFAALIFWGLDSALLWGVQRLTGRNA